MDTEFRDTAKKIAIPQIGAETWVSREASQSEIIAAAAEAAVAFCLAAEKHGRGIEAELREVGTLTE